MNTPAALETFLNQLLNASLQASVLVLLVLLAQGLARQRLTPRWRFALWWLVVLRLLLPFTPQSAFSLFNYFRPSVEISGPRYFVDPGTAMDYLASQSQPAAAPLPELAATPRPLARGYDNLIAFNPGWHQPVQPPAALVTSPQPPPMPDASAAQESVSAWSTAPPLTSRLVPSLVALWAIGALTILAIGLTQSIRFHSRLRSSRGKPLTGCEELLRHCQALLKVRRRITLLESSAVQSPVICGLWRLRLLLPVDMRETFSREELRHVFLHELAHVKRHDLWLNWLLALLQAVHWFNPVIWFGFRRLRADRELACDEIALEHTGDGAPRRYGETILKLLEGLPRPTTGPGIVGILEDNHQMKRRIRMIAGFRPTRRWGALSVAVILVLAIIGLTDAQTSKVTEAESAANEGIPATNSSSKPVEIRTGEDPSPETAAPDAQVRTLTVRVLNPDGKPLAGAEVYAPYLDNWKERRLKRVTDAEGRFILRYALPPGKIRQRMSNFSVSARYNGFVHRTVMWTSSGGDVYAGMPESVTTKLERGHTIGGIVQDERGAPLAGVRVLLSGSGYHGFTLGNHERRMHEYSEVSFRDLDSPAAITDTAGRWSFHQFAPDIKHLELIFVRPDGSRETYATTDQDGMNQHPLLPLAELEKQTTTVRLPDGVKVRGVVTDEQGRPLAGVRVKEGYGHGNMVRVGEFTTDADGRFERLHRHPRQWIYTAEHPDRATASVVAQVEPGMDEVHIVMPPPRPWRIEVVDTNGHPLPDVEVTINPYRTEAQILDWKGTTDASGTAVWTNAPMEAVTFTATSKALAAGRQFKIGPRESGRRVVLAPEGTATISVRLKAVDAKTRQPVKLARVGLQYNGDFKFRTVGEPNADEFVTELKLSDVQVGMAPSYQFRLEAQGYQTLTTDYYDFEMGDQELELALDPVGESGGLLVRLPDRNPAAEARLWAQATPNAGSLYISTPGRYYGDQLTQERADKNGRVKLPGVPADAAVVFTHSNGFFSGMMSDLRGRDELTLQPYGAVEGRLLVAGKPRAGVQVGLNSLVWSPRLGFHLGYTATTDAEGRFTFTQIPPGDYKLYRWKLPKRRDTSGLAITETYQWPLTVRPGQTNTIEYALTGRPVVGQALPEPANLLVDWQHDVHTLSLKLPEAMSPRRRVNPEDYATVAAFRKANDASFTSEAGVRAARQARTYGLEFESDGSFRVEDVPPGTYELRIRVTKPGESGRPNPFGNEEEIGALVREIVVPEGSGPLDLGTLTVPLRQGATVEALPPVALKATTLEGQPLDLAQFKGTNVLLVFWASWSGRSREQMPVLEDLRKQFADEQRFAIVGINLDQTIESARQSAARFHCPGVQGWLEPEEHAKVTSAFDVNQLPCVFLIDSEGRIVGRELEGEHLTTAVKRTLARK